MAEVLITSVNESFIKVDSDNQTLYKLSKLFNYRPLGYQFDMRYIMGVWDGFIKPLNLDTRLIQSGYFDKLITSCKSLNLNYTLVGFNKRNNVDLDINTLNLKFRPYDYQIKAIDYVKIYNKCVIKSATGSGKSLITFLLSEFFQINSVKKLLIVVPNSFLVNQLKNDFKDYDLDSKKWVDETYQLYDGADKKAPSFCTIATWQTLQNIKNKNFFEQFDALVIDEAHGAKSKELIKIANSCTNAFFKIGLSGSVDKVNTTEEALTGIFGRIIELTNTHELQKANVLANVKIFALIKNHSDNVDIQTYEEEMNFVANSNYKQKLILNVINGIKNENTLVLFTNKTKFGIPLYKYIKSNSDKRCYFIDANTPIGERDEIIHEMETGTNIVVFATYAIFSTGVNVKNLHNLIFSTSTKSFVKIMQSVGRILRLHDSKINKPVKVIDIVDNVYKSKYNYNWRHYCDRKVIYDSQKFTVIEHVIGE